MPEELDTEANAEDTEDTDKEVIPTPEVTGSTGEKVQPSDSGDESEDDEVDPLEALKVEYEKVRAAEIRKELEEQVRKEIEERNEGERKAAQDAQARELLRTSFADSTKKTKALLEALNAHDEEGEPITLTDDVIQKFIDPWQAYNAEVQTAKLQEAYSTVAEAVLKNLPKDKHDEFSTRAHQKPIDVYLKEYAELMAPQTEYARTVSTDVDLKIKSAEARGYARGQKAKVATPTSSGSERTLQQETGKIEVANLYDAARALAAHQIDDAKYLEYREKFRN